MGARCYDEATAEDMAAMADLSLGRAWPTVRSGSPPPASTVTLDKQGNLVPGTNAEADEMIAIGDALAMVDHGTMEIISDHLDDEDELYWIEHIARQTGRPLTLLVTPQNGDGIWNLADKLNPEGFNIRPQVARDRPRC